MTTTTMLVHDLKSPVSALETLIYSLSDRLHEEEFDIAKLAFIKIKDKFKLLKQPKKERKEQVHIIQLINEVISEKRMFYTMKNIKINLQQTETFFEKLLIEPLQFKRIMSNIIENAKEAMPSSGGNILIKVSRENKYFKIKIKDDGMGMSQEILELVKKSGGTYQKKGGSGQGLQHAKECLLRWGGEFDIDSLQGIGSIITLKIPI